MQRRGASFVERQRPRKERKRSQKARCRCRSDLGERKSFEKVVQAASLVRQVHDGITGSEHVEGGSFPAGDDPGVPGFVCNVRGWAKVLLTVR